jgi:hypothetical protein
VFNKTKQRHKFNITLNGNELQQNNNTKYLGVIIIDDKLNWKAHISHLCKIYGIEILLLESWRWP